MLTSKLRLAALVVAMAAACATPQSFNIDLDLFFGSPAIGNGAPSSSFGAAASQPGYWNRLTGAGGNPEPLNDITGAPTAATMLATSTVSLGSIGFAFGGNTGDFALLLNDASSVAPTLDGGTLTFEFLGIEPGRYLVYTYAVNVSGAAVSTPVQIPEATGSITQLVTGPMPGNSFEYLVTHSIHEVGVLSGKGFHITITQPPNVPNEMHVNGFQVVMVPEPSCWAVLSAGAVFFSLRLRRSH